jgi:hypothetical protein
MRKENVREKWKDMGSNGFLRGRKKIHKSLQITQDDMCF